MQPRHRFDDRTLKRSDGTLEPFKHVDSDLDFYTLLAANVPNARDPWSYRWLTTPYFAALTGRSPENTRRRVSKLARGPHWCLHLPFQSNHFGHAFVVGLGPGGEDRLENLGYEVEKRDNLPVPHELMTSLTAASFEIATIKHPQFRIIPKPSLKFEGTIPDLTPFSFGTDDRSYDLLDEEDTGSERLTGKENATRIIEKFEKYLQIIKAGYDGLIAFRTTSPHRMRSMGELLKKVIDRNDYPHEYAEHFIFQWIKFSILLDAFPPATEWAAQNDYYRVGKIGPFNFMRGTENG